MAPNSKNSKLQGRKYSSSQWLCAYWLYLFYCNAADRPFCDTIGAREW